MRRFVKILGGEHKLQLRCYKFSDDQRQDRHREQQGHFAQEVAKMLIEDQFRFVGEEIGEQEESIVEILAQAFRVGFDKIDMPLPLRINNRCRPLYSNPVSISDFPSEPDWRANKDRCHRLREEYMYFRAMEFIQQTELPAFIVCGQEHRDGLAERFRQTPLKVVTVSLADFPWFDRRLYNWSTP